MKFEFKNDQAYKLMLRIDKDVNEGLDQLLVEIKKAKKDSKINKTKIINAILRKALLNKKFEIEIQG